MDFLEDWGLVTPWPQCDLLCCLQGMFWVIVMRCDPSSVFWLRGGSCLIFYSTWTRPLGPSIQWSRSVPLAEKQAQSIMFPPFDSSFSKHNGSSWNPVQVYSFVLFAHVWGEPRMNRRNWFCGQVCFIRTTSCNQEYLRLIDCVSRGPTADLAGL